MTIVEAIKIVMEKHPQGITNKEAYEEIVRLSLYKFAGKNPSAIVNGIIRRHCYGLISRQQIQLSILKSSDIEAKRHCML